MSPPLNVSNRREIENRETLTTVRNIVLGATVAGAALGFLSARVVTHVTGVAISGTAGAACFGTLALANSVALTAGGVGVLAIALLAESKLGLKLGLTKTFLPGTLLMLGSLPLASYASTLGVSKIALLTLAGSGVATAATLAGLTVYSVDLVGKTFFKKSKVSAKLIASVITYKAVGNVTIEGRPFTFLQKMILALGTYRLIGLIPKINLR
jgi:hypothetical protein